MNYTNSWSFNNQLTKHGYINMHFNYHEKMADFTIKQLLYTINLVQTLITIKSYKTAKNNRK